MTTTAKPIVELYPIYFYAAWGSLTHADPTQKFLLYVHAYRSAQPCAKMVSHPLASSKEAKGWEFLTRDFFFEWLTKLHGQNVYKIT